VLFPQSPSATNFFALQRGSSLLLLGTEKTKSLEIAMATCTQSVVLNAALNIGKTQNRRNSRIPCGGGNFQENERKGRLQVIASGGVKFTSPKSGAVGEERFKQHAEPGTYWGAEQTSGERCSVVFSIGTAEVTVDAGVGENLLRVAERSGVLIPNTDFCYEGTCCHCEVEVEGGAAEVGYRADPTAGDLVRSCICPVPARNGPLRVRVLSEADAWEDGVL